MASVSKSPDSQSANQAPKREPRPEHPFAHRLRQFHRRHGRFVSDADLSGLAMQLGAPLSQLRSVAGFFEEFREISQPAVSRFCGDLTCVIARGVAATEVVSVGACLGRCDQAPSWTDRFGELHLGIGDDERRIRNLSPEASLTRPLLERDTGSLLASFRREKDPTAAVWSRLGNVQGLERHRKKGERSLVERWRDAAQTEASQRFVVCHADAGNPGTVGNAWLLKHRPQVVIDGMALAGLAVGATEGVICVHHDLPEVFTAVDHAIQAAMESGRLAEGLFEVTVVATFGSHVGGEETALLNAIEGARGEARVRPPEPEIAGLFGLPTVIETAEVFALLPIWLERQRDLGARLITVTPPFSRPGLVEVDASVSLRGVLREAGGDPGDGGKSAFDALLLGGPFGSVAFPENWDLRLDADVLRSNELTPGHWGITPLPVGSDLRALMMSWLDFAARETCGKCTPCRLGPLAAIEMLREPSPVKRARFVEILDTISSTSLCGFGRDFPRPLQQLIDRFGVDRISASAEP
ncbi:MAG: hypothetical protein KDN20_12395 [Verrucomicrobiae bacterium]|nr:hypothetical protein [Verrucomicrobiae bacterium]